MATSLGLRDALVDALGLEAVDLDRIAFAAGLRGFFASDMSEDRPAALIGPSEGSTSDEAWQTRFADWTAATIEDPRHPPIFGPFVEALGDRLAGTGATAPRADEILWAGYEALRAAWRASGGDAFATFAALDEAFCTRATAPPTEAPQTRSAVTIEVGQPLARPDEPIRWVLNREAGEAVNGNARIVGMPGVGKTQFLLHLLASAAVPHRDLGFVLLDYKGDLSTNDRFVDVTGAQVIRAGKDCIPINPFHLPSGVEDRLAPRSLAGVFEAVEPKIGPVQTSRLVRAMERAHRRAARATGKGAPGAPSLDDVVAAVHRVYEEDGCKPDTVLATLDDLARYKLFAQRSDRDHRRLFSVRWIVDLSKLRTLQDFVAFVLLEALNQAARGLPDAPFDGGSGLRALRGVVAIGEAHYYLKRRCAPLLSLIRVGRSKGVPVVLSSQSLEDFKQHTELKEYLPNTFLFKQGVAPDARLVAGALGTPRQQARAVAEQATRLDQFTAYARHGTDGRSGAATPLSLIPFFKSYGRQ